MTGRGDHVAFFEPYPHHLGGGQRSTQMLSAALARRGTPVTLVTPGRGPLAETLAAAGIPVEIVPAPRALRTFGHRTTGLTGASAAAALPRYWLRLARVLRRIRPTVVHAANLRGVLLAGPPARALRIPVVWHVHLGEPQPALNRLAARLAVVTVLPSAGALADLPGIRRDAVTVIANAVPPEALAAHPAPPAPGLRLVTAARLAPQKGLDVLIEAIPLLLPDHPDLHVTIYGAAQDGSHDYARDLTATAAASGLGPVVDLAGDVADPFRRYPAGAVYVQPSRAEILPLAILEAMAVGLPVVASDVGGVADLVVHGHTGLLVPPGDAAALAAAIAELLDDPERAAALGAAGARRARERFSTDAMADRWHALLGGLR